MKEDTEPGIMTPQDVTEATPDETASMEHTADEEYPKTAGKPKRKAGKKPILFALCAAVIVAAVLNFVFFALKPVQNAVARIDAIGDVTLKSEQTIGESRQAYDALPAYLQKHVSDCSVLTEAE